MKSVFVRVVIVFFGTVLLIGGAPDLQQPLYRPDLIVSNIDFQKVQSGTDSEGKTYWIFNVIIKVKNQGNGNAGAFKVLLERNNGAGGAYQACPTCTIDVPGLGAGKETALPPRQYNNANGMASKFRATADSAGQIGETNEGNNSREEAFFQINMADAGPAIPSLIKCDLTVVSWDFKDVTSAVVSGKTVISFKIQATVKNLGPGPSPTAPLRYQKCDNTKICLYDYYADIPPLASGAQTVVVTDTVTYEVGNPMNYCTVNIDPNHTISETNQFNNSSGWKKIPGTVN